MESNRVNHETVNHELTETENDKEIDRIGSDPTRGKGNYCFMI